MPALPSRLPIGSCLSVVALMLTANIANAQTTAPRQPFDGLFPGLDTQEGRRQRLDFTFSIAEVRDSQSPAATVTPVAGLPSASLTPGSSTMWFGGVDYRRRKRAQIHLNASSSFLYDGGGENIQNSGQTAGALFSVPIVARTTLTLTESVAVAPTLLEGLLPATTQDPNVQTPSATQDYTTRQSDAYISSSGLALSRSAGRRSSVAATGDYQFSEYPDSNGNRRRLAVYGGHAEYSHSMRRSTSFRVAYRYRTGEYGFQNLGKASEHGVDVGFDTTRKVTARKRVVFGFTVGASTIGTPREATVVGATVTRRYLANGEGRLSFQFRRSWQVRASFSRGLQYVGEFTQPVRADGIGLAVDGLFTKHSDFQASGSYSNGGGALAPGGQRFQSYLANVRWRWAFTNTLATFVETYQYLYDFQKVQPPPGFPPRLNRRGVSAGLMLWLPAMGRSGR